MTNDNWFDYHNDPTDFTLQSSQAPNNEAPQKTFATEEVRTPKAKQHRTVKFSALIACMLAAVLLGSALGAGFTYFFSRGNTEATSPQQDAQLEIVSPDTAQDSEATADPQATPNEGRPSQQLLTGNTAASTATVQECADTIVGIDVTVSGNGNMQATGSGSGVIITPDGYILTCNHVVEGANKITVYVNDGMSYDATVIGADGQTDLAVLKIEATNLPYTSFGDSDMLALGQPVIVIGNPLGVLLNSVSSGIISGLDREITLQDGQQMTLLQTDASVNSGNSGGGMFNSSGELIGIINAKNVAVGVEGLGFAIPSNLAKTIASDLMEQGFISGRPYLGVTIQEISYTYGNNGRNQFGQGFYFYGDIFGSMPSYETRVQIMAIHQGSAAEKAGLQVNDIILKINGTEIQSSSAFTSELNTYHAGDAITVTVQRGNQSVDISVTLDERTGK